MSTTTTPDPDPIYDWPDDDRSRLRTLIPTPPDHDTRTIRTRAMAAYRDRHGLVLDCYEHVYAYPSDVRQQLDRMEAAGFDAQWNAASRKARREGMGWSRTGVWTRFRSLPGEDPAHLTAAVLTLVCDADPTGVQAITADRLDRLPQALDYQRGQDVIARHGGRLWRIYSRPTRGPITLTRHSWERPYTPQAPRELPDLAALHSHLTTTTDDSP